MVTVGSTPPRPAGGEAATLSTTITPTAPASCTFFAFRLKVHVPRSTIAMRFFTARALAASSGVQARPVPFGWSTTCMTCLVSPGKSSSAPNDAAPTR